MGEALRGGGGHRLAAQPAETWMLPVAEAVGLWEHRPGGCGGAPKSAREDLGVVILPAHTGSKDVVLVARTNYPV